MGEDYSHALDSPGSSVTLVGHSSGWGCKAHCPNGLQKCCFGSIAPVAWGKAGGPEGTGPGPSTKQARRKCCCRTQPPAPKGCYQHK
jgi:hypothetical protein